MNGLNRYVRVPMTAAGHLATSAKKLGESRICQSASLVLACCNLEFITDIARLVLMCIVAVADPGGGHAAALPSFWAPMYEETLYNKYAYQANDYNYCHQMLYFKAKM